MSEEPLYSQRLHKSLQRPGTTVPKSTVGVLPWKHATGLRFVTSPPVKLASAGAQHVNAAIPAASAVHAIFLKSHDGRGANGSKKRLHDAYPVPGYYEQCSERFCVCQRQKCLQLEMAHSVLAGAQRVPAAIPAASDLASDFYLKTKARIWP